MFIRTHFDYRPRTIFRFKICLNFEIKISHFTKGWKITKKLGKISIEWERHIWYRIYSFTSNRLFLFFNLTLGTLDGSVQHRLDRHLCTGSDYEFFNLCARPCPIHNGTLESIMWMFLNFAIENKPLKKIYIIYTSYTF